MAEILHRRREQARIATCRPKGTAQGNAFEPGTPVHSMSEIEQICNQ
jgi:hypothetical protein